MTVEWARFHEFGYEVSSQGDKRFSALYAKMPDGRTIEQWYQCDIKGYDIGGTNWKLGKGKPSLIEWPDDEQWRMYLNLWKLWCLHNAQLYGWLAQHQKTGGFVLTDRFATSHINQARALAAIMNEWS